MEQKFDTPLAHEQVDPIRATEIMRMAGFSHNMFGNPQESARMMEVIKYFSDKEDASYVLNKFKMQTRGENILDHTYRFVKLRQQKDEILRNLDGVDKELSLYD